MNRFPAPVIAGNRFVDNLTGIYLRSNVAPFRFEGNDLASTRNHVQLGEAQTDDIPAPGNVLGHH
jgi:hypothetical protein